MLKYIKKLFANKTTSIDGTLVLVYININNFVGLAEKVTPENVVSMLQNYVRLCEGIILKHGGNIVQVEADCVLVAFQDSAEGAASKCKNCFDASIEVIRKLQADQSIVGYFNKDEFSVVISLCRGECIYKTENNTVIEVYGLLESKVERLNREASYLRNAIITDGSLVSLCREHNFHKIGKDLYQIEPYDVLV